MTRTLSKFCLLFDQATPEVHFLKAIKRSRDKAGLAIYLYYMILIALCACVCVCVRACVCVCVCVCTNAYSSQTVGGMVSIFCLPQKTRVQVSAGTSLEALRPSEVVETALHHTSVGVRCEMV